MQSFLQKLHALPEDARKLLAGVTIVVLGLGFVGVWSSFMSSRLVALGGTSAGQQAARGATVPVARRLSAEEIAQAKRREPPSPVAGITGSVSDAGAFLARGKKAEAGGNAGFFASVGRGIAIVAGSIYMKVAPWVPPY